MVLITSRQSNIIQDIATLHLFARCVGEECTTIDEKEVTRNAFELLFAFDEIVTIGYHEPVTLSNIHTILEMESYEENMQEMIAKVRISTSPCLESLAFALRVDMVILMQKHT